MISKKVIKQPFKNNQVDQNHRIHFIHTVKVWNIIGFQNRGHPHNKRDDDENNQKDPKQGILNDSAFFRKKACMKVQQHQITGHIKHRRNADDTCNTNETAPVVQISGTDECIDQNQRCKEHPKLRVFQNIDCPLHICVMGRASWHADLNFTGAAIHDFGPVYFGRISFWVIETIP
ncbi:MAG: hypothetical protein ACPG8Z_06020 [Paracoccaceae bacterium]